MTTSAESYDFGRYLQQLRRGKEIPLEGVSQVTKIRLVVLQQIENEDLKALPTPTITKGFIRAFADAVGADQDEALKRYDAALSAQVLKIQAQTASQPKPRPVWRNLLLAMVLIAVLIALSLYLVNLPARSKPAGPAQMPEPQETPQAPVSPAQMPEAQKTPQAPADEEARPAPLPEAQKAAEEDEATTLVDTTVQQVEDTKTPGVVVEKVGETPPADTVAGDTAVAEEALPTPVPGDVSEATKDDLGTEAAAEPPGQKLVLEVIAADLTYLKVTADDAEPREFMVQPGRRLIFDARHRFQLVIGNAAGVELRLNGKAVSVPGGSGKVVRLQLP